MALVTTPGAADADSYASLTDATAYTGAHGLAWAGVDADKETALRRATAWIDATYRGRFPGARLNGRSQALEWPRRDAYDAAGEFIGSATIPGEVVAATCEAAVRELAVPGGLAPDVTPGQVVKQEQVGPLSAIYAGRSDAAAFLPVVAVVDGLLSGLFAPGASYLLRA